jgi:hypothetical protein
MKILFLKHSDLSTFWPHIPAHLNILYMSYKAHTVDASLKTVNPI